MASAAPITTQPPFTTRARFRAELRDSLESAIRATSIDVGAIVNDPEAVVSFELPEAIANIPVVPRGPLLEALHGVFSGPLPPPAEREAEIRTNAVLNVWARCPNCGIHLVIPVEVEPQLTIGSGGTGELKVKAKSKGRIHACHQLTLDEPEGQLRAFAPDAQGADVEDVSEDAPRATPTAVHNMLLLVSEEFPAHMPSIEDVGAWDQVTLELVGDWASSVHLRASDHDVEIPDMPAVLATHVEYAPDAPDSEAPTPIKGRRRKAKPVAEEIVDAGEAIAETLPDVDEVLAGDALLPGERIGELACQGSNHVPGHTPGCPMYVAPESDGLDDLPL